MWGQSCAVMAVVLASSSVVYPLPSDIAQGLNMTQQPFAFSISTDHGTERLHTKALLQPREGYGCRMMRFTTFFSPYRYRHKNTLRAFHRSVRPRVCPPVSFDHLVYSVSWFHSVYSVFLLGDNDSNRRGVIPLARVIVCYSLSSTGRSLFWMTPGFLCESFGTCFGRHDSFHLNDSNHVTPIIRPSE